MIPITLQSDRADGGRAKRNETMIPKGETMLRLLRKQLDGMAGFVADLEGGSKVMAEACGVYPKEKPAILHAHRKHSSKYSRRRPFLIFCAIYFYRRDASVHSGRRSRFAALVRCGCLVARLRGNALPPASSLGITATKSPIGTEKGAARKSCLAAKLFSSIVKLQERHQTRLA